MIKVLHVYVRFHVYMYIYMCLDFANLFAAVIFSMFFFKEIDYSFIWYLSGKSLVCLYVN